MYTSHFRWIRDSARCTDLNNLKQARSGSITSKQGACREWADQWPIMHAITKRDAMLIIRYIAIIDQLGHRLTDMESSAGCMSSDPKESCSYIGRPDAHIIAANADLVIRGHAPGKDHSELSWHRQQAVCGSRSNAEQSTLDNQRCLRYAGSTEKAGAYAHAA